MIDAALALGHVTGLTGKDEVIWLRAAVSVGQGRQAVPVGRLPTVSASPYYILYGGFPASSNTGSSGPYEAVDGDLNAHPGNPGLSRPSGSAFRPTLAPRG